ncbi:hypothetical protein K0M31_000769 [Melipona bicolor]|uniref:Uncharacterized protein n=1 Tax=Melipona bicolor TaxID=60889 RepID=A0AA40KX56_9HYME|nr:hypothetical protein K0M31_000769 [Melipona bicolor]
MGESHAMGRSELKIETHGTAAEAAGVPTGRYSITRYVVCIAMVPGCSVISLSCPSAKGALLEDEASSRVLASHLRAEKSPRSPFSLVRLVITRQENAPPANDCFVIEAFREWAGTRLKRASELQRVHFFLVRCFFASQQLLELGLLSGRIRFKQYVTGSQCVSRLDNFRVNIRADDSLLNDTLIKHLRLEVGWLISVGERGQGRKGLMKVVARETAVSQEWEEKQCL